MEFLASALAALLAYSVGFALVRRRGEPRDGPRRSAHVRLEESRRDERAAHRQQGRGDPDAARRCRQGLVRRVACAFASDLGSASATSVLRAVGVAVFLGHLYPVYLRVQGRQGRGDGRRRHSRAQPVAGARHRHHLGDHRRVLPLCLAGVDRRGGVRGVLLGVRLGLRRTLPGARRDCRPDRVSASRQHLATCWRARSGGSGRRRRTLRTPGTEVRRSLRRATSAGAPRTTSSARALSDRPGAAAQARRARSSRRCRYRGSAAESGPWPAGAAASCSRRSRSCRFAPTPPATTSGRSPVCFERAQRLRRQARPRPHRRSRARCRRAPARRRSSRLRASRR